ncbi:hypothetical protein LXL04_001693 [Taraxacum kok-saghyz]
MVGDSANSLRLPAFLLLLMFLNSACLVLSGELPSITISKKLALLRISPKLVVDKSPGTEPGSRVVCERVQINGLSRFKNLNNFFSSGRVRVFNKNANVHSPNISICFHRNASLAVCMCSEGQWSLMESFWARSLSPFSHKLFLDIRLVGPHPSPRSLDVKVHNEFFLSRLLYLVSGILLMSFATPLSKSYIVYYGVGMTMGYILVALAIFCEAMRILTYGNKIFACALYAFIIAIGSFSFGYIPTIFYLLLAKVGISEDVYSPIAVLKLAIVVLSGALLGLWTVCRLVLTKDGLLDTNVAQFVETAFHLLASGFILQSTVDPILGFTALVCGILVPLSFKMLLKTIKSKSAEHILYKLKNECMLHLHKQRIMGRRIFPCLLVTSGVIALLLVGVATTGGFCNRLAWNSSICKNSLSDKREVAATEKKIDDLYNPDGSVKQVDTRLFVLWESYKESSGAEKAEYLKEIKSIMIDRARVDSEVETIAILLFGPTFSHNIVYLRRGGDLPIVDDWRCYETTIWLFEQHCGEMTEYGKKHFKFFANICNRLVGNDRRRLIEAVFENG